MIIKLFSFPSFIFYVLGVQKNHLIWDGSFDGYHNLYENNIFENKKINWWHVNWRSMFCLLYFMYYVFICFLQLMYWKNRDFLDLNVSIFLTCLSWKKKKSYCCGPWSKGRTLIKRENLIWVHFLQFWLPKCNNKQLCMGLDFTDTNSCVKWLLVYINMRFSHLCFLALIKYELIALRSGYALFH